jgi:hypothetical protein
VIEINAVSVGQMLPITGNQGLNPSRLFRSAIDALSM